MNLANSEKRSSGSQVAFIDLLFLLIAFFTLIIFFIETKRTEIESKLETTQQRLEEVADERDLFQATMADLGPMMMQFMVQQRQEAERRRKLAAKALRRSQRPTDKIVYEVLPGGLIRHEGTTYRLAEFKKEIVSPRRTRAWLAFRAYARPETPFGDVVRSRALLLKNSSEFDTYWDNLTRKRSGR